MSVKKAILRFIFFLGWLLSPLTFWNDVFINIPLSYLLANLFIRIYPANFLFMVLIFYWLSNALGLFMMYLSGKDLLKTGRGILREIFSLVITVGVYSLLLAVLHKAGILRPF